MPADTGKSTQHDIRTGKQQAEPDGVSDLPVQTDGAEMSVWERVDRVDRYESLGKSIGELVARKQAAYGDSFGRSGQVMSILYPHGISPDQMHDALAVVRIVDKLFRIATDKNALGESPYRDIAGYGLLGAARSEQA